PRAIGMAGSAETYQTRRYAGKRRTGGGARPSPGRVDRRQPGPRPGVAAGIRFIARHPVLRPYLACCTVLSLCYAIYFTLLIPFAVRDLHLSSAQIGLAVGTGAAGALAGSVLTVPL